MPALRLSVGVLLVAFALADDYNQLHRDGGYDFSYDTPDAFHAARADRRNVVRGEFGARSAATGALDVTEYTAGPRGFRPRGRLVHRRFDLAQGGGRPDEDAGYAFGFRTRAHSRREEADRAGEVTGRYSYVDDVGERHDVEYEAGRGTGFHVKTPYPDSNLGAYAGRLFVSGRGKGKGGPRGRTSVQRGLDGSYRFVSAGPDQRRTESSDATGHVRGSYTYLDDKGVQHSVHYIAGPETGFKVLKNVKGPHLPPVYPFDPTLDDPYYKDPDVFDAAATGHGTKPFSRPSTNEIDHDDAFAAKPHPSSGEADDAADDDFGDDLFGNGNQPSKPAAGSKPGGTGSRPGGTGLTPGGTGSKPGGTGSKPGGTDSKPSGTGSKPSGTGSRPPQAGAKPGTGLFDDEPPSKYDDGSYKPDASNSGAYIPPAGDASQDDGSYRPRPGANRPLRPSYVDYDDADLDPFATGYRPPACDRCRGTIVTNVGDRVLRVPPGVSVRAHVQSIDLLVPDKVQSPSERFEQETEIRTEQLNSAASSLVSDNTANVTTTETPTTVANGESTTEVGNE